MPLIQTSDLNITQTRQLIELQRLEHSNKHKTNTEAPFREPHHTSSYSEIIGNKNIPGEIVLANKGILFLDEMSETNKRVIEGLRQPLEDRYIQINQGEKIETDFVLIGSMNPCDCGFYKSKNKRCICTKTQRDKFQRKISSPLFQRFDLTINMTTNGSYLHKTDNDKLTGKTIFENITRVRSLQKIRKESFEKNMKTDQPLHSRHILLTLDSQNEKSLGIKEKELLSDITKRFYFSKEKFLRFYASLEQLRTLRIRNKSKKNIYTKHYYSKTNVSRV